MKNKLLLLTAIISVAYTLPFENDGEANTDVNSRNTALEQIVLDIIEDLRETMLNGSDDIPVLDPFELDHLHLDLRELGFEDSHITLNDMEARQLSTFVVDDLTITATSLLLQRYTFEIEGHIPVLEIDTGNYDLNVKILGLLSIFGNGSMKLRIREPRIKARIDIAISIFGGTSITIRDANVIIQLASFETEITGMLDDNEIVAEFLDDYIGLLVPEMVTRFQDDISDIINSILIGMTIDLNSTGGNILKPSTLEAIENFKSTIPTNA